MPNPLYRDPKMADKLQEAIRLGFIRHETKDGMDLYALTQLGQQQWMMERVFNVQQR